MDLALHLPYPNIKQGFRRGNLLLSELTKVRQIADAHSPSFGQSLPRTTFSGRICHQEIAYASIGRLKKGLVSCTKESNSSNSKQEEIISLFRRIQTSISKGESVEGVEEEKKNRKGSLKNVPLSKAILDILEKPRKKTAGDTSNKEPLAQPFRPSASGPRGSLPVSKRDIVSEEMPKKEEKASLIETMKLAELKEVAKNKGIKGYSKLKKSELLALIKSY